MLRTSAKESGWTHLRPCFASCPATLTFAQMLPIFQPLPVVRRPRPFNGSDWLFELKYDGFQALAYVDYNGYSLVGIDLGARSNLVQDVILQALAFHIGNRSVNTRRASR